MSEILENLKISQVNFTIPEGDYYGSSPLNRIYNGKDWNSSEKKSKSFYQSIKIECNFVNEEYQGNRGIKVEWEKGEYKGEKISENSSIIFKYGEDNSLLFTDDSNPVFFRVYSYIIEDGKYIYQETPFLDISKEDDNNKFFISREPRMYTNGTSIPTLNSNYIRIVDFFEKKFVNGEDYKLIDLRAETVSDVPIYGFKIYASLNKENLLKAEIVKPKENSSYVFQKENGQENSVSFVNNIYVLNSSFPAIDNPFETGNYIIFKPNILDNAQYLRDLLNKGESLETLDNLQTFYYTIVAVNELKQESKINYTFKVDYDFRLKPIFFENPKLINSGFESVTITDEQGQSKKGYLFYGQTETDYDWITFEWYPAFNKNDYLKNKENYIKDKDKYYLLVKENFNDPNYYTLYKWLDNEYNSKRLIFNIDYKIQIEEKTIENTTYNVVKYIAKYAMNIKNFNKDEYFNLTLMPFYIDIYNEEKMATPTDNLYPIQDSNGEKTYFHLSRFIAPTITFLKVERENQNKFIAYLKVNDWGVLTEKGINKIFSSMILRNSDLKDKELNIDLIADKTDETLDIKSFYENKQLVFDFEENKTLIYDNMPFSTETKITVTIDRFSESNYIISKSKNSSVTTIYNYYIPAKFSTLSLRKNKIGINKSDLTAVEEALYIVAKDRIDDENNLFTEGGSYPHVVSIQGNINTKMPDYNKATGKALNFSGTANQGGTYIGFYSLISEDDSKNNEDYPANLPYRIGSIGMDAENGEPYFIFKGKYALATKENPNGNQMPPVPDLEKRYDKLNYFERFKLSDMPVPVGTIIQFIESETRTINGTITEVSKEIPNGWYKLNGEETKFLNWENDADLIKILYNEDYSEDENNGNSNYTYTLPSLGEIPPIETSYTINRGPGQGLEEINITYQLCYLIRSNY